MGNFNRFNVCLLVAAAVAIPGIAHAAYTANPRQPTTYWVGTDGVWRSSVTVEARSGTLPTKYLKTTVPLSVGSLGRLVKSAMTGPVGIGLTAALLAADMYYDSGTGEIMKPVPSPYDWTAPEYLHPHPDPASHTGTYGLFHNESGQTAFTTGGALTMAQQWLQTLSVDRNVCGGTWLNSTTYTTRWKYDSDSSCARALQWGMQANPAGTTAADIGDAGEGSVTYETATETEIGDLIRTNSTLTKQVANDSIDRGTWRGGNWPEMESSLTGIESALDRVADGTATQDDINLETGASAAPAPAPAQQQTTAEWPTFCSWAGVVCDFIDWYKAPGEPPPHPDLPIEEVTLSTWESGLGAGSCPAPYTTEFQGQTISYPFDDACWAAESVIRPLLLTLSLIGAGLIIVGRS